MRSQLHPAILAIALASLIAPAGAQLPVNDEPLTGKWAPSEWGPDDKVGAVNRTTPELVLKAVRLVKRGKSATLGKVYASDAPAFGTRGWKLIIPGRPTGGPFGDQQLVYNDDYVATELGQIGTQFDGPGHIGVITSKGMYYYNGRFLHDKEMSATGLGPLGVEHVAQKGFVCRGVLLDAVALRGGALPVPKENSASDPGIVTAKDVQTMVERQRIAPIGTGDCVFLYTGHGDLWHPRDWDKFDCCRESQARRPVQRWRAGLRHLCLRVSGGTQGDSHRRRHMGDRGRRQGIRRRDAATLRVPSKAADQAWHLES